MKLFKTFDEVLADVDTPIAIASDVSAETGASANDAPRGTWAAIILKDCEETLAAIEKTARASWQFPDQGSMDKNMDIARGAHQAMRGSYADLFESHCDFEAEVNTLGLLAQAKEIIVKDFVMRATGDNPDTPPLSAEDFPDRISIDGIGRALACVMPNHTAAARKLFAPIAALVGSDSYTGLDAALLDVCGDLQNRLQLHAKAFQRTVGASYRDVFDSWNRGVSMNPADPATIAYSPPGPKPS